MTRRKPVTRKGGSFDAKTMIPISPAHMPAAAMAHKVRITHSMLMVNQPRWEGNTHRIDAHLFVLVERGTLMLKLDDKQLALNAGTVCWLPPGTMRKLYVESGVPARNWRLRFSIKDGRRDLGLNCPPIVRGDCGSLLPHLQLLSEVGNNDRFKKEIQPLLSAFILRFLALPELSDGMERQLDSVQRRRVEVLVERGLVVGVTPAEMAEEAGLSPDYFTRLFKATYGIPPRRYLLERRMELAGRILRDSTLSVKEVCVELGESDVGTFCRLFKRVMGKTPTHYRRS